MQFKTSYSKGKWFSGTLFWKNLTRFWPLWTAYALLWLFMGPVQQFFTLFNPVDSRNLTAAQRTADAARILLMGAAGSGMMLALVAGPLFAVALFSYLYSARSVGMMHSFPISRKCLFLTNYCTGLAVIAATLLTNAVCIAIVQGIAGVLLWKAAAQWLLCTVGEMVTFYTFAVFCGMFTGQAAALPIFYVLLNGAVPVFTSTVTELADRFLYGYSSGGVPNWLGWFAPAIKLSSVQCVSGYYSEIEWLGNLYIIWVYLLVSLVLAAVSLLIYQRRRSETAGDIVSVRWAKQLFRFGAGLFSALTLGQILYSAIYDSFFSGSMGESLPLMLVFALIGFYAAEMLIEKSFRVFRKAWKGAVLAAAIPLVLCMGIKLDITGFEKKIPVTDREINAFVGVNYQDLADLNGTKDQRLMQQVLKLHQSLIDGREENEAAEKKAYAERTQKNWQDWTMDDVNVRLHYYYSTDGKNYQSIDRRYDLWYDYADLNNPDSTIAQLAALYADPEFQTSLLIDVARDENMSQAEVETEFLRQLTGGSLTYGVLSTAEGDTSAEGNRSDAYLSRTYNFGEDDARAVAKAYLRDIKAGHVGRNTFAKDATDHTYSNELVLTELSGYYMVEGDAQHYPDETYRYLRFDDACTETAAELKRLGIVNETRQLHTNAEARDMTASENVETIVESDLLTTK